MSMQFGRSQKIVIVEDNQALSEIYRTRLELLGYTVFAAYDGVQALAVIEKELPDLVLLDLMVPKVAGDQVLERMRESDWGKDIRVMIISNLNEAEAPVGLRNLGIEGYAIKANLSNDQLDKLVEVILKPVGQAEDVLLAHDQRPELTHSEPSTPPDHRTADPFSGTRMQDDSRTVPIPAVTPPAEAMPAPVVAPIAPAEPIAVEPAQSDVQIVTTDPVVQLPMEPAVPEPIPAAPEPPAVTAEAAVPLPVAPAAPVEISNEDKAL